MPNNRSFLRSLLLSACALWVFHTPAYAQPAASDATKSPLPPQSVYHLGTKLEKQDGSLRPLEAWRGGPVLISMFYNSCQFVCPMLIDTIKLTEDALTPEQRKRVSVVLITFDPERDTQNTLQTIARQRNLSLDRWTVARTDAASVRKLAAALGIQYRQLANGDFNHSTTILLLDSDGNISASTNQLGEIDPTFVSALKLAN